MESYDVFSDPEFKADRDRDQILYENICPNCGTQWEDEKSILVCPCLEESTYTCLMKVECSWCKADMGTKPCNEGQQDEVSHGICGSCKIKMEEKISDYEEVR